MSSDRPRCDCYRYSLEYRDHLDSCPLRPPTPSALASVPLWGWVLIALGTLWALGISPIDVILGLELWRGAR